MIFSSALIFIHILVFILIYNGVVFFVKSSKVSNILLIVGNIIILSTTISVLSILIILLISLLVFYAGLFLSRIKNENKGYLAGFIGILIVLFLLKNYRIVEMAALQRLGLSYILFRLIHFLVDSSKGKIKEFSLMGFLNYIIFFPTFIAGPIDEYNNFVYWIRQKRNSYKTILVKAGIFRLMLGITKKFFLVPIIASYALDFSLFEPEFGWKLGLVFSLLLYSLYILFDFSGYTDIAIGTAYLIGIKTPENFDNPYFSSSLGEFWRKWHMTFSNFLFKYIFKPTVTYLSKQYSRSPRLFISSIGYLITFMICGVWHGNTLNFFYWGLWNGVGLIFFKMYEVYIYKRFIISFNNTVFKWLYKVAAIAFTFIFVTIGWLFFNYQTNAISAFAHNIINDNSEILRVNTVVYDYNPLFKIKYSPINTQSKSIDIRCKLVRSGDVYLYSNVPLSNDSTYYLGLLPANKDMYEISVRENKMDGSEVEISTISYLDDRDINQNIIQKWFFGENRKSPSLIDEPHFLKAELEIPKSIANKDTKQNIKPGKYNVRLIYYFNKVGKGVVLNKSVIIPNYVDGKKDN